MDCSGSPRMKYNKNTNVNSGICTCEKICKKEKEK